MVKMDVNVIRTSDEVTFAAISSGYKFVQTDGWFVKNNTIDSVIESLSSLNLEPIAMNRTNSGYLHFLCENKKDNVIISVEFRDNSYTSFVFRSKSLMLFDKYINQIKEKIPPYVPDSREVVQMYFTYADGKPDGYCSRRKDIDKVDYEKSVNNYTRNTRSALSTLHDYTFNENNGGRLVLLHGKPGTGKTSTIRALASSWNDWAQFYCVLDPENFFGPRVNYVINSLLHKQDTDTNKVKVFVLEDTGELLTNTAKAEVGQALSRLLNLADGLLGQDMRCIFIITTNENIYNLHPAITRPGRCLANIEFETFTPYEAEEWLRSNGLKVHKSSLKNKEYSLADLFQEFGHVKVVTNKIPQQIGVEVA